RDQAEAVAVRHREPGRVAKQRAQLSRRRVSLGAEPLGELAGALLVTAASAAEGVRDHPENERDPDPGRAEPVPLAVPEPEAEDERTGDAGEHHRQGVADQA